jgi:hypothetical protein
MYGLGAIACLDGAGKKRHGQRRNFTDPGGREYSSPCACLAVFREPMFGFGRLAGLAPVTS